MILSSSSLLSSPSLPPSSPYDPLPSSASLPQLFVESHPYGKKRFFNVQPHEMVIFLSSPIKSALSDEALKAFKNEVAFGQHDVHFFLLLLQCPNANLPKALKQ